MAKQTKKTKEKRQGAPSQAGVKAAQFFKRNIYVILMIICILAIATMITVAVILNNTNEQQTFKPIQSGEDINSGDNNPSGSDNLGGNKPNTPSNPDDEKPVDNKPQKQDFVMANPLDEFTLGQIYSEEHVFNPTHNYWAVHEGTDFLAAEGSDVKCVFDGVIKEVSDDGYYGSVVTIEHQDGFVTIYKLLDNVSLKVGDSISKGDVIGKVSATALDEIAEGAHLHLELYKDNVCINPADYLLAGDK